MSYQYFNGKKSIRSGVWINPVVVFFVSIIMNACYLTDQHIKYSVFNLINETQPKIFILYLLSLNYPE